MEGNLLNDWDVTAPEWVEFNGIRKRSRIKFFIVIELS